MTLKRSNNETITARDCSPIEGISPGSEEERWLRELCRLGNAPDLTLKFGSNKRDEVEPIATFDPMSGQWVAGRYIGELDYKGRTLLIEPRFGMPVLRKWLAQIWGIKILPTKGEQAGTRVWLWLLLAFLWSTRLSRSARHGLPCVRVSEISRNRLLRGRLRARDTGFEVGRGTGHLVGDCRERRIDPSIAGVIIAAHDVLELHLRDYGARVSWLSTRSRELVKGMSAAVSKRQLNRARIKDDKIRFTPMTQLYKPVVELSMSILHHRPFGGVKKGEKEVHGVLLDIAEVWEYYVYRLLRDSFPNMEVLHLGRDSTFEEHLLKSEVSNRPLSRLYPDICVHRVGASSFDYIIDAKYKAALCAEGYRNYPQREDLYQVTSYLAALGKEDGSTIGLLAYPIPGESEQHRGLQSGNPWSFSSSKIGQIQLLGIPVEQDVNLKDLIH